MTCQIVFPIRQPFKCNLDILSRGRLRYFWNLGRILALPFCSIHKALTPEEGWSCLGLAEGYQALEAPTSKAHRTSAFWVRHLDVTNRKGHGLLMFIDALLSGLKKKTCETVKLPGVHGCREAHTPKEQQRAAPYCFVPALGEATADCSGEFVPNRVGMYLSVYITYTDCDISVISISYTQYTHVYSIICKYISNMIITSMVTKTKKNHPTCFQDADNVKALMAGATALGFCRSCRRLLCGCGGGWVTWVLLGLSRKSQGYM